jgi:hypothetical protein
MLVLILWTGCNSFDEPGVVGDSKVVIPTDTRGVSEALHTLPAISGGTLKLSNDDAFAVVSDPDRDRVSVVSLVSGGESVTHIALEPGDEPGRVEVDSGRAYVALRGSGDVLTLDLNSATVLSRTHVCSAPRGLAVDPTTGLMHVACAEGRLVSLSLVDDSVQRDVRLAGDLRDVLVTPSGLRVSTFKSSQLLTIDDAGLEVLRTGPEDFSLTVERDEPLDNSAGQLPPESSVTLRPMQSHLAWRAVQTRGGSVLMLHQAAAAEEVDITKARKVEGGQVSSPYGGGGSSGGAAPGCQGVVVTSVSTFGAQGPQRTIALQGGVLDVDMAVSPDDSEIAIVEAGLADLEAPVPTVVTAPEQGGDLSVPLGRFAGATSVAGLPGEIFNKYKFESRIMRVSLSGGLMDAGIVGPHTQDPSIFMGCEFPRESIDVPGQATAVAYTRSGSLVVQSREPALLTIIPLGRQASVVELGGDTVRDTGHELFHRDSGGGIACASCHAEGAEDGHTWNFTGQGVRRTQALHIGLAGTAPFHWAGDETDLNALMEDVFVGRMGGVHQSEARVTALSKFLFALEPPTASRDLGDPAAMRGKALFESAAGCASCHVGAKFTDNKSYDVGTSRGERLQVPSLRGVGYRAPFIHTGCAQTLRERFDPACGGSKHGNTAGLSAPQVDDLVAYLQTL